MISHVHRCIFIHVPKVGGTSIEEYLRMHAAALGPWPEPGLDRMMRRKSLAEMLNRHPDYFAFAFVRHPFDRLVSAWLHGLRENAPSYFERPTRDLTLGEYVRIAVDRRVAEQSEFDRYHLLPQVSFIPDASRRTLFGVALDPRVTCGFVGRYERLEDDFRMVCQRLGIPAVGLPWLRQAPREAGRRWPHWSERFDAETRRLATQLYQADFEAFGYE